METFLGQIDFERQLYIRMTNQGILTFFVGKSLPNISTIYS